MTNVHPSLTNRLLGYPDDARLLLVNADDLGMCHAVNAATFHSLREGIVRSTSLMVPCPWALHAMEWLGENPDIPFGVHLTLICDTTHYKWGPLTAKEKVPSLVDEAGYCYSLERMHELLDRANIAEVELEFRAQIEAVLAAGLKPTHLDWHCLHSGGRADIFDLTFRLAREYGLALRVADQPFVEKVQSLNLPTDDHPLVDSYDLDPERKREQYRKLLRELPEGLTEWAVHPGLGNDELQTIEPGSWRVRQTDYEFLVSQEAREIVAEEGIVLVDYRALQAVWNEA